MLQLYMSMPRLPVTLIEIQVTVPMFATVLGLNQLTIGRVRPTMLQDRGVSYGDMAREEP